MVFDYSEIQSRINTMEDRTRELLEEIRRLRADLGTLFPYGSPDTLTYLKRYGYIMNSIISSLEFNVDEINYQVSLGDQGDKSDIVIVDSDRKTRKPRKKGA